MNQLKQVYESAGQGHVFHFWNELKSDECELLLKQLSQIDPHHVNNVFEKSKTTSNIEKDHFKPPPSSSCIDQVIHDTQSLKSYLRLGMMAIKQGRVGVIVLAGGQGTRLGSPLPKGCFDFGLPSGKTLFQLQAERIDRLQFMSGGKVHWYIMTSSSTRDDTISFFKKKAYFGLEQDQIHFFQQANFPCLTTEGKIILETKYQVAMSPNGNGGMYAALTHGKVLEHMESVGIDLVHVYCVDNSLVKVADPIFIGSCIAQGSQLGIKTVKRINPDEPVGLVCLRNGKIDMVEYTEVPKTVSHERDHDTQSLVFDNANIANHFFTREFLQDVSHVQLGCHVAHKKIPCIDIETGKHVKPDTPNGIKLEQFIVDVFPMATTYTVYRVDRKQEFSPLKNKTGKDSIQTAMWDLLSLHCQYLNEAGVFNTGDVEVSPRLSYAGEGLFRYHGEMLVGPMTLG